MRQYGVTANLEGGALVYVDLNFQKVIWLQSPYDNDQVTLTIGSPHPVHQSPIQFSWQAIPEAEEYFVTINRYTSDPYAYIDTAIQESVSLPGIELNLAQLPLSAPGEHYQFSVHAMDASGAVGYYMTTYTNGHGWDYRFRLE
jgi:hypothetical protein